MVINSIVFRLISSIILEKSVGSRFLAQTIDSTALQKNTRLTKWVRLIFLTYKDVGNAGFAGAKTCQITVKPIACTINLRPTDLSRIIRLFLCGLFFLYAGTLPAASEQVSIQLKWKHGFQFAGYYAAIEKGFYREAGLDVTLKEIDFSKQFVEQVIAGESEYGVSDSALLVYHLKDKPMVLLNQVFQYSPLVFLSRRGSGIISPYEMLGKKVAFNVANLGDVSLNALLLNTLGDASKIQEVPFGTPYYKNFIDGKTDVVSAYSTSQPYLFKQQGVEVNIINPQNYGVDFYGDNFFTTQKELDLHPKRVEKMSVATKKGW